MNAGAADLVRKSPFFSGLSDAAVEALARVCRIRNLKRGDTLFHEAERGESVYLLAAGRIGLHKTAPDGSEVVIRTIQPGEIFAEVILFEVRAYPVTAVALTTATVYGLDRRDVQNLLDNRQFRNDWIAMLFRKQRYLAERVQHLVSYDVEERFCLFLLEQYGPQTVITTDIAKKDMASAVAATPETFSRMLQRLASEGCIEWTARKLKVAPAFWQRHRDLAPPPAAPVRR